MKRGRFKRSIILVSLFYSFTNGFGDSKNMGPKIMKYDWFHYEFYELKILMKFMIDVIRVFFF